MFSKVPVQTKERPSKYYSLVSSSEEEEEEEEGVGLGGGLRVRRVRVGGGLGFLVSLTSFGGGNGSSSEESWDIICMRVRFFCGIFLTSLTESCTFFLVTMASGFYSY